MVKVLKYPCPITLDEGENTNRCNICKETCFSSAVFSSSIHICSICLEKNYLDLKIREMSFNTSSLNEKSFIELSSLKSTKNQLREELDYRLAQQNVRRHEKKSDMLSVLSFLLLFLMLIIIYTVVSQKNQYSSGNKTEVKENHTTQQVPSNSNYHLTVKTTPWNATVKILNIEPKYHDGIALKADKYNIHISKNGYKTQQFWVKITGDTVLQRTLER